MRILQRVTIILFAVVALAFVGTKIYTSLMVDRISPVITCDSDVIEAPVGAPDSVLLSGVTATDNKDGDISDQVMIKGISQLITADTAKITYIVFDSSNNMTTAQRTVRYTNYERPRLSLAEPLVYQTGNSIELLTHLTAKDTIDGDISGSIRVTNQNVNSMNAGVYSVTLQVTNSLGDVESVPVKVVVRDYVPSTPPVVLSEHIVYIDAGSTFYPSRYILSPAGADGMEVDSQVNSSLPGAYEVSYTYQNYTVYQTVVVR